MPFSYILRRVKQKSGLDDLVVLTDYINEACRELYKTHDYPGSLLECVVPIYNNTQIALPPFIGEPRAFREYETSIKWKYSSIRTRYHEKAWPEDSIRNFRDKGMSPLAVDLDNSAPPIIVVPAVEANPITVTIIGSTDTANRVVESKLIDAESVAFETPFTYYESIKKDRFNDYNISITDADGNEISVIYNNELEANFRILDTASYPIAVQDTTNAIHMEILFKKKLYRLEKDTDEFPCKVENFDDIIVDKTLFFIEADNGNAEKANLRNLKADKAAKIVAINDISGKDLRLDTTTHPHDMLFQSMRRIRRF